MRFGLVVLLVFLVSVLGVAALDVSYDNVNTVVLSGQQVKYLLHVKNDKSESVNVQIKSLSLDWILDEGQGFYDIKAGETRNFGLTFSPLLADKPAVYGLILVVESEEERVEKILKAEVLDYKKIFSKEYSFPVIDPRRGTMLKFNFENKYDILLHDLMLSLDSDLITKESKFSLNPKGSEVIEFEIDIDDVTPEGKYPVDIKVIDAEENVYVEDEEMLTVSIYHDVKEVIEPVEGFLVSGEKITQMNDGNSVVDKRLTRIFSALEKKFTKFDPVPSEWKIEEGKYIAVWSYSLEPGESKSVRYVTNFKTPLIVVIAIVVIILLVYFIKRKPLSISKKVLTLHTKKGDIAIMKVLINIKNTSKEKLHNVSVVDRVPNLIKAPVEFGVLKPSSVKKIGDGARMVWSFHSMVPGEERVISYKVESKVYVLGKLTLPPAVVSVKRKNRKVIVRTNQVVVSEKK